MDGHSRVYVSAGVINFCVKCAEETEKKKKEIQSMHIIQMSLILYKKINKEQPGKEKKKTRKKKLKKSKARSENSEAKPFIKKKKGGDYCADKQIIGKA